MPKVNGAEESNLSKIFEQMAQINRKLDKLDATEGHLERVHQDIKGSKHPTPSTKGACCN